MTNEKLIHLFIFVKGEDEDFEDETTPVNIVPRIEEPIQVSSCDEGENSSSSSSGGRCYYTLLYLHIF